MSDKRTPYSTASTPTLFDSVPETTLAAEAPASAPDEPTDETSNEPEEHKLECLLTGRQIDDTPKEKNLQEVMRMLLDEYSFEKTDLERDFHLVGELENGKKWRRRIELVVFAPGKAHTQDYIVRLIVVTDQKVKANDPKKGQPALEEALGVATHCEFGMWSNGTEQHFVQAKLSAYNVPTFDELSDFPGANETLADLDRLAARATGRTPANESLVRTFRHCHDYIYGNEGHTKDAFWQLLNLIFCKIYDEKRRDIALRDNTSYRRRFWVGVKEKNDATGQKDVAKRIRDLFDEMKGNPEFADVFEGGQDLKLTDQGLAYVAAELARYAFLDATVDVKGTAYETIVGNTLKRERGQFFTPRNIVKAMVEMMDPQPDERVLDPSCGSGGFLVQVLDHVRRKLAQELYPVEKGVLLQAKFNAPDVNEAVQQYARTYQFGIDFDDDLKRAARMNMVMAGDGQTNIYYFNSLQYPNGPFPDIEKFNDTVQESLETAGDEEDRDPEERYGAATGLGSFDLIFSNPPFGAKIPIVDKAILKQFDLGYVWRRDANAEGGWYKTEQLQNAQPPEILFIDRCYQLLKPGGRLAIVLPDGILGNPNTEYVRAWLLSHFRVLASLDLPVEAFLPQVGVQASLLFLQKLNPAEQALLREPDTHTRDYQVFMAIAERVGKDRRGVPVYERDEDGKELFRRHTIEYLGYDVAKNRIVKTRDETGPTVDDDLPKIARAYREFLAKKGGLRK